MKLEVAVVVVDAFLRTGINTFDIAVERKEAAMKNS